MVQIGCEILQMSIRLVAIFLIIIIIIFRRVEVCTVCHSLIE